MHMRQTPLSISSCFINNTLTLDRVSTPLFFLAISPEQDYAFSRKIESLLFKVKSIVLVLIFGLNTGNDADIDTIDLTSCLDH